MANCGRWLALASWVVCSGCVGTDQGGSPGSSASDGLGGRGTLACQTWQAAVCDLAADECQVISRAQCDEQYQSIECKSDSQATACANAFNASSCSAPPSNCDLADIADPAPAVKACNDFINLVCQLEVKCDATVTMQTCVDDAAAQLSCDAAIGVTLSYETCIKELKALPCTAPAAPDSCKGAIKVLQ